jgi:hypothetical protein
MLALRARGVLSGLMLLTALVQVLDAGLDAAEGRWTIVPGVLIFALVFFLGAARLRGQLFWNLAAWKEQPQLAKR